MFNCIVSALIAAGISLAALAGLGHDAPRAAETGPPLAAPATAAPPAQPAPAAVAPAASADVSIAALLDPNRVPYLPQEGREDYRRFLLRPLPRAFAVSREGAWGWASGIESDPERTAERALANCRRWGGSDCRLYARDLAVLWPGLEAVAPAVPDRPLVAGPGYAVVPDARFLWHGPQAARGAYVWAHGRAPNGIDSRGAQPQPHVRPFNHAGYDVLRFDRDPATDETEAGAAWLREALASLRAQGYRRIVVGGQSRGAWNALQALDRPGLADAVVAIAPAAHGPTGSPAHAWALDDLRRVVAAAQNPKARVIVANFADDPFDPDPEQRAAIFRALSGPRVGALLFLDRPQDFSGHGAGADWRFTQRYGACLLDFAEGRATRCGG
jgi:hypothetical protein